MKKFIYIALLAFTCALTVTSCTEEEVKPNQEIDNGGNQGGADREVITKG